MNNVISNSNPNNNDINQNELFNNNNNQKELSSTMDKIQTNQIISSLKDQIKKEINIQKNNYSKNKNSLNQSQENEEQKQFQKNQKNDENQNKENFELNNNINEEEEEFPNPIFYCQIYPTKNTDVKSIESNNSQKQLINGMKNNIINNSLNNNNSNNQNIVQNHNNNSTKQSDNNISKTCFKNCGETSYLNAVLHCLINIEELKKYFLDNNNDKYIKSNIKTLPLTFVTSRLFKHFYVKKDKIYSLESYLRVLASKNKIYETHQKRNANDCLSFILNFLDNELNRPNNKNGIIEFNHSRREEVIKCGIENFKNAYNSIIYDIFNWFQLKELRFNDCGGIIYNFNTYNTFQLDILEFYKKYNRNNFNINDCLKFEINKNGNMYCPFCKKTTGVQIISTIYKAPKVFVFLLNDGEYDGKYSNFQFSLEESININDDQNSLLQYQLIGIVSIDVKNRKYVSFCKLFEDQQWYLFNDETFSQINQEQVILYDVNKYIPSILFYKSFN